MRRLVRRSLTVSMLVLAVAACSNPQALFPAASVKQVSAVAADGTFTVTGANFFQYPDGAGMRVEVCGVTLPADIVAPAPSQVLLPPAGVVRVELGDELRVTLPAGPLGGSGALRVVRPDGQVTVVEGAVVCPSATLPDPTAVAVLGADVTEGYAPLQVSFDASGSSGEGELSVLWDFGDGATSTAGSVQHTFTTPGEYLVTLLVNDETGSPDTATALITVLAPAVTSVTVELEAAELYVGQSVKATAVVAAVGGASEAVTWSSTDTSVLTVSETGLVTAVGEGEAEVVATSAFDPAREARAAVRATRHVFADSTVLLVVEGGFGSDPSRPARAMLEAARDEFGLTLEIATARSSELDAALAKDPDLVYYVTIHFDTPIDDATALVDWVRSGGRLVYTSWWHVDSHQVELLAALGVTYSGDRNHGSVTVLDPGLADGMATASLTLANRESWGTYSTGLVAGPDSTVLAEFEDGRAAIVAANGGRTMAVGFFPEAVTAGDDAVLFTNLVERALLAGL